MSSTSSPDSADSDLDAARRIDQWCLEFENDWLQQRPPVLSQYLARAEPWRRSRLLRELLELDVVYRSRAGEAATAEDYADLPQEHQPEVLAFFEERDHSDQVSCRKDPWRVGQVVGRFELLELIGQGGFGVVYRARDPELQRHVAIKAPRRDAPWSRHGSVRFLEEARTAASLSHPRLAKIFDVGRLEDGGCYLVMPLLQGDSLRRRIAGQRLTAAAAAQLVLQIAEGVQALHQAGLVHRDLSPDNIMLDSEYGPVVIDFGLAMFMHQRGGQEVAGSHRYMAPEQLRGETEAIDARTDVWALGAVLFELLHGAPPFTDEDPDRLTSKILNDAPVVLDATQVPSELRRICGKCLSKSTQERYANAGQLAAELSDWVQRVRNRRQLLMTAGSAACGALAASAAFSTLWRGPAVANAAADLELDVQLYRDAWRRLSTQSPLSLEDGDRIRVRAASATPRRLYLLWRDAAGDVAPLFPFLDQQWILPEWQETTSLIELPSADPHEAWDVEIAAHGYEAVLLLAARRPLRNDQLEHLRSVLHRPWPTQTLAAPWCGEFRNGQPSFHRGPDTSTAHALDDPMTLAQQGLAEELSRWFDDVLVFVMTC